MASNDSGVDTSNDSNEIKFPFGCIRYNNLLDQIKSIQNMEQISTEIDSNYIGVDTDKDSNKIEFLLGYNVSFLGNEMNEEHVVSTQTSEQAIRKKYCHRIRRKTSPYNQCSERKLRMATAIADVEHLTNLLKLGTNPNSADEYQRTSLHLAASRGFIDIVAQLLAHGANPNQLDSLGNTPLHLAVCSSSSINFYMVVRLLLKYGANVHSRDRMGKTPLDLARSKLALMRMGRHSTSDDIRRVIVLLMALEQVYLREQQQIDENEMNSLESKLQCLTTKEIEDEADLLLAKVKKLTIKS